MSEKTKETRQSKYDTHVKPRLQEVKYWCREGLIEDEISKRLGISRQSLNNYKNQHPELMEAMRDGKAIADYRVEDALFKRAIGYKYEEVTKERVFNENTKSHEEVVTKRVTKEVAADPTSMIFWLKNRKSSHWRDKQDINIEGNLDIETKYSHLSEKELDKEIDKMKKALENE